MGVVRIDAGSSVPAGSAGSPSAPEAPPAVFDVLDPYLVLAPSDALDRLDHSDRFEIVFANAAAAELVGRSAGQVLGADPQELWPGWQADGLAQAARASYADRLPLELAGWFVENDDVPRWLDVRLQRVGDQLHVALRDVSARHLAGQMLMQANDRLMLAVDAMPDPLVMVEPTWGADGELVDLVVREANAAARRLAGLSLQALRSGSLERALPGADLDEVAEALEQVARSGRPLGGLLLSVPGPEGTRAVHTSMLELRAAPAGSMMIVTWRDVTVAMRDVARLADAASAADSSPDPLLLLSAGKVTWASAAFTRALGWQASEVVGRRLSQFVHDADVAELDAAVARAGRGQLAVAHLRLRTRAGQVESMQVHAARSAADRRSAVVVVLRPEADGVREAPPSLHDAGQQCDPVTGLVLQEAFLQAADRACGPQRRPGDTAAIAVAEVDALARVRREHGALGADALLRLAARRLVSVLRREDLVARIGDDRFAVLLHAVSLDQAAAVAGKLRAAAGAPVSSDLVATAPSLRVGMAMLAAGDDPALVLEQAAAACSGLGRQVGSLG